MLKTQVNFILNFKTVYFPIDFFSTVTSVVELTGDVTPDKRAIEQADVIVTTPEKGDGISRSWQTRNYVKSVTLLVIDEIHLLGDERGPVLEVIVSRTNFISSHTERTVRVVGLSTALANARDLADWLGIGTVCTALYTINLQNLLSRSCDRSFRPR